KPVTYPHASVQDILQDTYGIIVYQEQVMRIAVRMAGYTMGQADELRRVMGKKKRELISSERERFVRGCADLGHSERLSREIFDLIEPFSDYGFPMAHACSYAYVAYQTAYLKAHHPVEYMAAILTSVRDDKDRKPYYLNAARLMGVRVLPPDVNLSQLYFTPSNGEVRYGLAAVRNVGAGVVQQIIEARATKGPFESFTDFCRRVDSGVLHKKVLESLILAGAFDSLGYTRGGMLGRGEDGTAAYEKITTPILSDRRAEALGQDSLFGGSIAPALEIDEAVVRGPEFDKATLLRLEK